MCCFSAKKKSIAKAREILTKELTTKNESITKRDLEIAETNAHLDAALHDKELLNGIFVMSFLRNLLLIKILHDKHI